MRTIEQQLKILSKYGWTTHISHHPQSTIPSWVIELTHDKKRFIHMSGEILQHVLEDLIDDVVMKI